MSRAAKRFLVENGIVYSRGVVSLKTAYDR